MSAGVPRPVLAHGEALRRVHAFVTGRNQIRIVGRGMLEIEAERLAALVGVI